MTDTSIIEVQERKGYIWISFPGSINRENVKQIQSRIETEIKGRQARVVFDLSGIKAPDSTVINFIVNTRNKIREEEGTLSLTNLTKDFKNLLQTINLDKILTIYRSEEEIKKRS